MKVSFYINHCNSYHGTVLFCAKSMYVISRAGPRLVGSLGRLIFWQPFKLKLFTILA